MSYNGYNQFSPYYQQQSPQQNSSGQYTNDASLNGSYPSNSFQPLNAYQSDHQRQQPTQNATSSSELNSKTYRNQNYTSTSITPSNQSTAPYINQNNGRERDFSGFSQDSSSAYANLSPDTSALGNLAYASSLGQDQPQPSLAQLIDHNRSRPSNGATGANPTNSGSAVSHGHQKVESQYSSSTGNQQSSQAPSHLGSYNSVPGRQSYSGQNYAMNNTGRSSPTQHQYVSAPQPSPQSQQYSHYSSQPPRPASGQAMQHPDSRTNAHNQATQVPTTQVDRSATQSLETHGLGQSQASNTSYQRGSPAANETTFQAPKSVHQNLGHQNSPQSGSCQNKNSTNTAVEDGKQQSSSTHSQLSRPESANTASKGHSSQPSTSTGNSQPPTTVDPNQVFNHSEYQRRRSEAEAARKEAEAAIVCKRPKLTQSAASASTSLPADDVTEAAKVLMGQSSNSNTGSTTREQIELEMKHMIEKMRDYKAKDPALFSQVWENVKKVKLKLRCRPPSQD